MNTRSHDMEMVVAARQVEEVTKALFHTILLHRTTGKYEYSSRHSGTFSVGVVGMEDVDLSTLDFTYVRCTSRELDQWLSQQIEGLPSSLCQPDSPKTGKITLEFYERKKGRWLLPAENVSWEVWHLILSLTEPTSEEEWEECQQCVAEKLATTVQYITDVVNRPEYIPRNPTAENLPNVFDIRFPEVQPYLHRIVIGGAEETVAGRMQKLIRNISGYQM
ncbi:Autophagy-related protein 101 [Geodia barretti]|uniref:Autophagy-related protein 101 n=1 Tax=Geodia barretti TaxID=519541 RepID=A0AA35WNJ3_GEOBA|nr:Autophagy-related protein 101 [Geodia barretti]